MFVDVCIPEAPSRSRYTQIARKYIITSSSSVHFIVMEMIENDYLIFYGYSSIGGVPTALAWDDRDQGS